MKTKDLNLSKTKKNDIDPIKNNEEFSITKNNLELSSKNSSKQINKSLVKKKRNRKKLLIIFFIFVAILGSLSALFIYFIYIPGKKVYDSTENIKSSFYSLLSDIQNKDVSRVEEYLGNIKNEIAHINLEIDKFDFLANLDQTKGYYDNFQQTQVILKKSDALISQTLPEFKELLELSGFKVDQNIPVLETETTIPETTVDIEQQAPKEDGAITLILKNLPQYLNLYGEIEPKIIEIFAEVNKLNPDFIPSVGGLDIKDNLAEFNKFSKEFPEISNKTINFIKEVPNLIGSNKETSYLVILQNETEMRSSGGLLTAFGTIKVKNGEIADDISLTDTWQLQYDMWRIGLAMPRNNIYGQAYLMNSGCGATEARVQDVGIYPDLNISMNYFAEYYDRAQKYFPEKYPNYDQIVILNYAFSENLLELVQPLEIEGFGQVNAENLYNFIKDETDNPAIFFDEGRKDIIKTIAKEAKDKLLNLSISEIPKVLNLIISSFQAKDIALTSKDPKMQAYFDQYGMNGRSAQDFDGDYFQFNEAQNCALKLNKFIRDTVDLNVDIADDGSIKNNVQVKWQQPQIYNDSLAQQYSPSTQFSYRAWVRFMIPEDSTKIISDGLSKSGYLYYYPKTYFDNPMNKEVSDNIVQFDHRRFNESDPVEKDDMSVSWNLPASLNYNTKGKYRLLIQKHPGKSWGEPYKVNINYQGTENSIEFVLDRDKLISFKDGILTLDNYDTSLDWLTTLSNKVPWDELKTTKTSVE